jgi:hypothetical protein
MEGDCQILLSWPESPQSPLSWLPLPDFLPKLRDLIILQKQGAVRLAQQ